jgi:proteasome lid subunit RPN8/RPN11
MTDIPENNQKRIAYGRLKRTEQVGTGVEPPQVIEMPFPYERTLLWKPRSVAESVESYGGEGESNNSNMGQSHVLLVVAQEVLLKVSKHVATTLDRELGGFLLGNRYRCPNTEREYVIIDQYSPAKFTESTEVNLSFTHEAWAHLSDDISGKFIGKLVVGWYHSHPRMDVFLSRYDMEIQHARFSEPWMSALVLEPEKHRGGFFCWRDGNVNPNEPVEFYEQLERNTDESVVAWENYIGVDQATGEYYPLSQLNTITVSAQDSNTVFPRVLPAVPASSTTPLAAATNSATTPPDESVEPSPASSTMAALRGNNRPWLLIPALLVFGFVIVVAGTKLVDYIRGTDNQSAESAVTPPETVDERAYLSINQAEEMSYRRIKDDTISVYLTVTNPPESLSGELGGQPAKVEAISSKRGENQRVRVSANLKEVLQKMKAQRDQPYWLDIRVFDAAKPLDNFEVVAYEVDPRDLFPANPNIADNGGEVKIDKTKITSKGSGIAKARAQAARMRAEQPSTKKNRTAAAQQKAKTEDRGITETETQRHSEVDQTQEPERRGEQPERRGEQPPELKQETPASKAEAKPGETRKPASPETTRTPHETQRPNEEERAVPSKSKNPPPRAQVPAREKESAARGDERARRTGRTAKATPTPKVKDNRNALGKVVDALFGRW